MATIREIAKRAGVSLGTVDRVLHARGRVSDETAARIKAVIDELGFTPNLFARNLSTSRSYRFGILMPAVEQDGGYWRLPLKGMERSAETHKAYQISLETAFFDRYKPDTFRHAHNSLCNAGVDGILMAPVIPRVAREVLEQPGMPIHVTFDTMLEHPAVISHIGQDSARSGRLAARLMRLLCPSSGTIVVLQPNTDNAHIGARIDGFRGGMEGHQFRLVVQTHPSDGLLESYQKCLDELMKGYRDIVGIVAVDSTTHLTAAALDESLRTRLPIIGYDLMAEDIPWLESGAISFLLTQDPIGQGKAGIDALFNRMVIDQDVEPRITVPLNIVTHENWQDFLAD